MGNMYDVVQARLGSIRDSQGRENTWTSRNTNGVLEEYMLKNIWDATMPKEAWDTIASILILYFNFSRMSYCHWHNKIWWFLNALIMWNREISKLDFEATISETRMKRIIIHGLKPKYQTFVATLQGWPTQPSIVKFKNLHVSQENMAKHMTGVSLKGEEKLLYTNNGRSKQWLTREDRIHNWHIGGKSNKDGDKKELSKERRLS